MIPAVTTQEDQKEDTNECSETSKKSIQYETERNSEDAGDFEKQLDQVILGSNYIIPEEDSLELNELPRINLKSIM